MHHEFMRVMLHNWMEFLSNNILQVFYLNNLLLGLKCILIEKIETVTIAEVISLGCYTFVLRIFLGKVVIS